MREAFFAGADELSTFSSVSTELDHKVSIALLNHVYRQTITGMIASLFCASVVSIGLYSSSGNNFYLYVWLSVYLLITFFRISTVIMYNQKQHGKIDFRFWNNLYILGALLGGLTWGLPAIILFPGAAPLQQMLLILMLAGVTAGAVPLSSGIPAAAIAFLVASLAPFIIILTMSNSILLLYDLALILYLIYTIMLSIKNYHIIKNSFQLRFENDGLLDDLTDAKKSLEITNKKLVQAATHDPLTGAANRILFQSNLNQAIKHAKYDRKILALFFIDLDHFKPVNDTYGHQVGDKLLINTYKIIQNYFGNDVIIGRLGGDEFTTILENAKDVQEITAIAKKLCSIMAMPILVDGIDLHISASIGVSIYPIDAGDCDSLLRQADIAMYNAKEEGGNCVSFAKKKIMERNF